MVMNIAPFASVPFSITPYVCIYLLVLQNESRVANYLLDMCHTVYEV